MASAIEARYPNTQTIAAFCEFIDNGKLISPRLSENGIPAYEVGHILPRELKGTDLLVSNDSDKVLQRHDLLTGRVGGLGAFSEYNSDLPASFSDNILRISPKKHEKHRVAFVAEYLNSNIGNTQLVRGSSGSLQKVVTQKSLGEIVIPILGRQQENQLVAEMDAARAQRKAQLAEAEALLAGIDGFVLDTLGIQPPPADTRRIYAVNLSQMRRQARINSEYYHPERTAVLRSLASVSNILKVVGLAEVVSFVRQQLPSPTETYLSLAHVQSDTGELTDSTDTATGTCFVYQPNDVLFARLRPYLNKVHRAETGGSCSTEFHVLRIADTEMLLPDYLAAILRSKIVLAQTVHMMAGNTHPRLTNDDVANLKIAIPTLETQQTITAEITRRRQEARRLRAAAETGWLEAKMWFEAQILEGIAS